MRRAFLWFILMAIEGSVSRDVYTYYPDLSCHSVSSQVHQDSFLNRTVD